MDIILFCWVELSFIDGWRNVLFVREAYVDMVHNMLLRRRRRLMWLSFGGLTLIWCRLSRCVVVFVETAENVIQNVLV